MMQLIQNLLGGGAAPKAQASTGVPANPNPPAVASTEQKAVVPQNLTRDAATTAISAAPAEAAPKADLPVEAKPDEKQTLLMKAVEALTKTFGSDLQALTKLLLKANPDVAKEAVTTALKAALPVQAPALNASPAA